MDTNKDLGKFAIGIIILSAIILAGIAVVKEYGQSTKTDSSVVDETLTIASGAATTANDEITVSSVIFQNVSDGKTFINGNDSADTRFNITSNGVVQASTPYIDGNYNISYEYLKDSDVTTASNQFVTGLAIFGAFAGILVISMIGRIVIGLFKKGM